MPESMNDDARAEAARGADETPVPEARLTDAPRRSVLALPEGWFGILLLLLVAALSGGVVAAYWPALFGAGETTIGEERVAALEARVGQLAAGRTNAAASGMFDDLRRALGALSERLDADEARLTALEKTPVTVPPAPGQPAVVAPGPDAAVLRGKLEATAQAVAQLNERIAKIEGTGASSAQISDAIAKFTALQARVAALDADIARSTETQKGTMDAVNARLAAIEAAVPPNLAQRLDDFAPKSDMAAADARVARLEAQNAGDALHRAAAILALANLARAAGDGKPFTLELDALAAAAPDDPAIGALRPWSATGIPTAALLRPQYAAAARNALDVARTTGAQDFFSRLWSNIEGLISVRRIGEVQGNDLDARLARAGVRVNAGDLSGAIAEVAAVKGPAAAPLAPWLRDARNRVALDRTIAQLNARVVRALAAQPTTPATTPIATMLEPPAVHAPQVPPVPSRKP